MLVSWEWDGSEAASFFSAKVSVFPRRQSGSGSDVLIAGDACIHDSGYSRGVGASASSLLAREIDCRNFRRALYLRLRDCGELLDHQTQYTPVFFTLGLYMG